MKLGVIVGDHVAEVREHPTGVINDNQVLVKNMACNICTTDYQQWLGLRPHQKTPMAFGHENAGVIFQVGANVKNVKVGDHVVVNCYFPCLECANCRKNKNSMFCLNPGLHMLKTPNEYGYYGYYGCAEDMIVDSKYVFKIADSLPFEQGAFCEPVATVLHGIHRLNVVPGEHVLVIGAGTMGILNAQVARYFGADVIISEVSEEKLDMAKRLGFAKRVNVLTDDIEQKVQEYAGSAGVDAAIIAVGVSSAYEQAVKVIPKGGRLLIFSSGYPKPEWPLEPNLVHYEILDIIGTYGCSSADFQAATELLGEGRIDVACLVENRFPLEDIQKAFEAASTKEVYRTAVLLNDYK